MAENVLIDLESGVAHWFDFETVHDSSRSMAWRRADDVRALLVTCLVRTDPEKRAEVLRLILDVYADEEVTRVLATSFTSVFRRAAHLPPRPGGVVVSVFPGDKIDPSPMLLTPGARLGPYEIESLIGSGGMGEVYKAHDRRLNRTRRDQADDR